MKYCDTDETINLLVNLVNSMNVFYEDSSAVLQKIE